MIWFKGVSRYPVLGKQRQCQNAVTSVAPIFERASSQELRAKCLMAAACGEVSDPTPLGAEPLETSE